MPGFVIHVAIGQEYLKKHLTKDDYDEFIRGNIQPDLEKEKIKTHYGKSPAYTSLYEFLKNNKIDDSLNRGKFLHLIADYLFYNSYLEKINKEILHNDYDIINERLIKKYDVKLPENIKQYVFFKNGIPEILDFDLASKVIDEVSNLDIEKVAKEVLEKNEKWNKYKRLI